MAHKFWRSSPSLPRRNVDYSTDYDASPSQSPYTSNEDDGTDDDRDDEYDPSTYMASESVNFAPGHKLPSKVVEIKGSDLNSSPNSASNTPKYSQCPNGTQTLFPYINVAPLPIFHGGPDESPAMHISRFAKVCRANNAFSVDMMMRIFPVTLEDEAALWYDLNIEPFPLFSWEEIKSAFLDAYNKIELADQLRSELMTINQGHEETIRSYFLRLQLILKKWPDKELPDGLLRAIFIDGLRDDFKGWIIPQKPCSLNEALRLAFSFEQVRSIRTSGKKLVQCGFCEGPHEEQVCEVRERMRELWKRGREKKKVVDMAESDGIEAAAAARLVRLDSVVAKNGVEDEKDGGEMMGLKKKRQCQCWKHQCGKKRLDRNLSIVSKNSKAD